MNRFTRDVTIRFEHCDPAGLMFYPRFFALVNETVEDWFAALGHSFKTLHIDQRKGVPTVRFEAEFVAPRAHRRHAARKACGVDAHRRARRAHLKHIATIGERTVARFDQTIVFTDLADDEGRAVARPICARRSPAYAGFAA